jgi:5-methylcytosine-specific restriction endonuclease McrA
MNFTLNEYHRNLSDDELLLDVIRVANALRKQSITVEEYDKNGKYNHTTLSRRFGSWKNVLQKANLNSESCNFYISNEEYINNLKEVAILLKQNTITTSDYKKYGKFNDAKLSKRFGGWAKGGETEINNLQTLCSKCNLGKSDMY